MILRYPHVRLAMLNRLAVCGDCDTAFRETALTLGFEVPPQTQNSASGIQRYDCMSLSTAYSIFQKTAPTRADVLFKELRTNVDQYQKQMQGKTFAPMRMRTKDKCDGLGVVVMDYMLQLIEAESCDFVAPVNQAVAR